jgi:hypothetical protein
MVPGLELRICSGRYNFALRFHNSLQNIEKKPDPDFNEFVSRRDFWIAAGFGGYLLHELLKARLAAE